MILWDGETMFFTSFINWRKVKHEPVWLEWYDYQAACNWYQCRRCEEKFYLTHEFMEQNSEDTQDQAVNELHEQRIEKLASGIH